MQALTDTLLPIVNTINGYLSDYILVFLLMGAGLYFSFKTKFVQVRCFGEGMKRVFGNLTLSGKKHESGMSSFQALATAIAAQVGTGNIVGASGAILTGGPGAIFWMWIIAFFGMATIYAEAVLAQKTRVKNEDGQYLGGPVYYIRTAFQGSLGKFLAAFFAIAIILALGFTGCMVQSNSIGSTFSTAFGVPSWIVGIILVAVCGFIFVGGVQRLASVTEKLVPIMAAVFLLGGVVVLIARIQYVPATFGMIFKYAFQPQAIVGGAFGTALKAAISQGAKRGLFSNEAGMGSTPNAHAQANVAHPCQQGQVAIVSVFIDTFCVLNMTAFVIIGTKMLEPGSPAYVDGTLLTGIGLTQAAFNAAFGSFGAIFIAICMLFFAFSTILGWYFFGESNVRYLFGDKAVKPYIILVCIFIIIGSLLKVETVWNMSDCFNSLMVVPNVIGLFALTGLVKKTYKDYRENFLPNHPEDGSK